MKLSVDRIEYNYGDADEKAVAEQFSLVGELDEPNMSYEFNTLRVLKHKPSGRLFYGISSGCSCPTPFEEFSFTVEGEDVTPFDMDELKAETFGDFERAVHDFPGQYSTPIPFDEKRAFVEKVRAEMKP